MRAPGYRPVGTVLGEFLHGRDQHPVGSPRIAFPSPPVSPESSRENRNSPHRPRPGGMLVPRALSPPSPP